MGSVEIIIDILNDNQSKFMGMNESNLHSAHDISEIMKDAQSTNLAKIKELEDALKLAEVEINALNRRLGFTTSNVLLTIQNVLNKK